MAKKRVHELAKQYDMPTAEVMKRLNAYGLNVKAAASAVDEGEADRALTGKTPPKETGNGAKPKPKPQAPASGGMGFNRPTTRAAQEALQRRQQQEQERKAAQQREQQARQQQQQQGRNRQGGAGQGGGAQGGGQGANRQRPTRSSLQGERAPGAGGGVRRVVIDSQAA